MEVARTTVQAIYNNARCKLAKCLVYGKELSIQGGEIIYNNSVNYNYKREALGKDGNTMKLAVTFENGEIFQHFGHTESFKIYEIEDGHVISSEVVDTNGSGHGALASLLNDIEVSALICGGIGGGARMALEEADIMLYAGVEGDADAAVSALLAGTLEAGSEANCDHHGHGAHDGNCGEHGCGEHSCGGHCGE